MLRLAASLEGFDDDHAAAATGARFGAFGDGLIVRQVLLSGRQEQLACLGDRLGFDCTGEEAVVADAVEALG